METVPVLGGKGVPSKVWYSSACGGCTLWNSEYLSKGDFCGLASLVTGLPVQCFFDLSTTLAPTLAERNLEREDLDEDLLVFLFDNLGGQGSDSGLWMVQSGNK